MCDVFDNLWFSCLAVLTTYILPHEWMNEATLLPTKSPRNLPILLHEIFCPPKITARVFFFFLWCISYDAYRMIMISIPGRSQRAHNRKGPIIPRNWGLRIMLSKTMTSNRLWICDCELTKNSQQNSQQNSQPATVWLLLLLHHKNKWHMAYLPTWPHRAIFHVSHPLCINFQNCISTSVQFEDTKVSFVLH